MSVSMMLRLDSGFDSSWSPPSSPHRECSLSPFEDDGSDYNTEQDNTQTEVSEVGAGCEHHDDSEKLVHPPSKQEYRLEDPIDVLGDELENLQIGLSDDSDLGAKGGGWKRPGGLHNPTSVPSKRAAVRIVPDSPVFRNVFPPDSPFNFSVNMSTAGGNQQFTEGQRLLPAGTGVFIDRNGNCAGGNRQGDFASQNQKNNSRTVSDTSSLSSNVTTDGPDASENLQINRIAADLEKSCNQILLTKSPVSPSTTSPGNGSQSPSYAFSPCGPPDVPQISAPVSGVTGPPTLQRSDSWRQHQDNFKFSSPFQSKPQNLHTTVRNPPNFLANFPISSSQIPACYPPGFRHRNVSGSSAGSLSPSDVTMRHHTTTSLPSSPPVIVKFTCGGDDGEEDQIGRSQSVTQSGPSMGQIGSSRGFTSSAVLSAQPSDPVSSLPAALPTRNTSCGFGSSSNSSSSASIASGFSGSSGSTRNSGTDLTSGRPPSASGGLQRLENFKGSDCSIASNSSSGGRDSGMESGDASEKSPGGQGQMIVLSPQGQGQTLAQLPQGQVQMLAQSPLNQDQASATSPQGHGQMPVPPPQSQVEIPAELCCSQSSQGVSSGVSADSCCSQGRQGFSPCVSSESQGYTSHTGKGERGAVQVGDFTAMSPPVMPQSSVRRSLSSSSSGGRCEATWSKGHNMRVHSPPYHQSTPSPTSPNQANQPAYNLPPTPVSPYGLASSPSTVDSVHRNTSGPVAANRNGLLARSPCSPDEVFSPASHHSPLDHHMVTGNSPCSTEVMATSPQSSVVIAKSPPILQIKPASPQMNSPRMDGIVVTSTGASPRNSPLEVNAEAEPVNPLSVHSLPVNSPTVSSGDMARDSDSSTLDLDNYSSPKPADAQCLSEEELIDAVMGKNGVWFEDVHGETFLHALPAEDNEELALRLFGQLMGKGLFLEALNKYNKYCETPLSSAVVFNRVNLIRAFISAGADVNCLFVQTGPQDVQHTPLHLAVERGQIQIVKMLLSAPRIDINAKRRPDNFTPLMVALRKHERGHVRNDRLNIIQELLEAGVDLECKELRYHKTALMMAVETKDCDVVQRILESAGVEHTRRLINQDKTGSGNTAMHIAAGNNIPPEIQSRMLALLIQFGGDTDVKNNEGTTPKDYAKIMIGQVSKVR